MLLLGFCLFLPDYADAQRRVCRPSTGKRIPASESVFIQVTDETNGRVVTYQKEFKLDHIPPAKRDAYITHLEDSLLYSGHGGFRFGSSDVKHTPNQVQRKSAQKSNANAYRRVAGVR